MSGRLKEKDVRKFFEDNEYILYDDFKYQNGYTLIDFQDKDGYKYSSYYECLASSVKNGSKPLFVYFKNPYTIYNISRWIENNNKNFNITSKEYVSYEKQLEFECNICHKIFKRSWIQLNTLNKGCPFCENLKWPSHAEFTEKDMFDIIEKYNSGIRIGVLCKEYHCRNTAISDMLKDHDIKIKRTYEYYTSKELGRTRKYYCKEDIFETIDSHDKAYWLGFLYADGNVHVPRGKEGETKGIRIELSLKEEDYYHLRNFSHFLQSNYPVKPKYVKCNGKRILVYRVSIGSVKMGKDLISHGCIPRKSLTLKYPDDLEDRYFGSFLCGYFDGDGCLSFIQHDNGSFSNNASMLGSFEFLSTVNEKLNKIGINTRRGVVKTSSKAFMLEISNYSHADFYNLIYNKSSYMLGRKFDKFRDMLGSRNKDFEMSEVAKLARYIL